MTARFACQWLYRAKSKGQCISIVVISLFENDLDILSHPLGRDKNSTLAGAEQQGI